jgi:UDP-glucuronate 4-epimerase
VGKILLTGASGFIGYHVATLLKSNSNYDILAIDSFKPAYPTKLTEIRSQKLSELDLKVRNLDLLEHNPETLKKIFGSVDIILHLAAFPGVRTLGISNVETLKNNLKSFETISNFAREVSAKLIYASSSSVYGDQGILGPCEEIQVKKFVGKGDYALSKWENEKFAFKLLKNYQLKSIGLRFFSVFGVFGREDMAYFKFANQILRNEPLSIYGSLNDFRDYTPIDYVTHDIKCLIDLFLCDAKVIEKEFHSEGALPILNLGSGQPKSLQDIINLYTEFYGKKIDILNYPRQQVESLKTWSNNDKRNRILPSRNVVSFEGGLESFLLWHRQIQNNEFK